MTSVTISPKFQIVIPAAVRRAMHLTPGQKVQVIPVGNRIELFPVRPIRELRGRFKDIALVPDREDDRL
jgi:AbrB family looped-hinge helix DNA binding protein